MRYVTLFLILITLIGCEKSQLPFYKGGEYLYFKDMSQTVSYSFPDDGKPSIHQTSILIPIALVGEADRLKTPLAYSIEFRAEDLKVIGKKGDLLKEQFSLQPGQQTDTLHLNIFRELPILDTALTIQIRLHPPPPYDADISLAGESLYTRSIDILIDDQYKRPESWSDYEPYFGSFSSKKMRVLAGLMGNDYSSEDFYDDLEYLYVVEQDVFVGIAESFVQYLTAQKEKGSPVLERNGKEMLAGPLMY